MRPNMSIDNFLKFLGFSNVLNLGLGLEASSIFSIFIGFATLIADLEFRCGFLHYLNLIMQILSGD